MFDFRRITLFCLEKRLSKHKMTIYSKHLGGHGPFGPHGYAYGSQTMHRKEKVIEELKPSLIRVRERSLKTVLSVL